MTENGEIAASREKEGIHYMWNGTLRQRDSISAKMFLFLRPSEPFCDPSTSFVVTSKEGITQTQNEVILREGVTSLRRIWRFTRIFSLPGTRVLKC